jgi:hypothetical protein
MKRLTILLTLVTLLGGCVWDPWSWGGGRGGGGGGHEHDRGGEGRDR